MDSPDVWALKPPNTLITHKYEKLTEKSEAQLKKKIHSHYFNQTVKIKLSIFVPKG